jgi:transposase
MADHRDSESKIKRLEENSVFNRSHAQVHDPLFSQHEFFCPYDLMQVKYEMVRRVHNDEWTVSRAAQTYGFSRVSFYETQKAIEDEGIAGLIPRKRGPKGAHKLTAEVMGFAQRQLEKDPTLRAPAIADLVEQEYGFTIHPRSIDRALQRSKKKRRGVDETG